MSNLTYPALRCILEHVDVQKRLYIAARSKNLKKVEKAVTLRSKRLILRNRYISLNNFTVEIESESDKIKFVKTARMICERVVPKEIAEGNRRGVAVKKKIGKVNQYYFGGRSSIIADQLQIDGTIRELNLPENFNLKVNELNCHELNFQQFFSFGRIESSNITSQNEKFISKQVCSIVENFKQNENLPSMTARFSKAKAMMIANPLSDLKAEFQQYVSQLEGVDELFIPGSLRYCIFLENNTKIMIFGVRVQFGSRDFFELVVKVITDTTRE
ncbi:hypothetical protein CRE_22383 [Caenorhabditis remanei]|uniref:Uncharacterized protein n=1 Tax=Caenorhabditis remanei TaxID=31234 RepID=E3MEE6_CAERE|nr:hypothetical protein CRE_22383 [Caenorhabditis remanei]